MAANLRDVQHNTQALAKIFNHLNKLERLETDVITLLPELSDDEVMETRNYAKLLGRSAWKIECACDAEIWNRTYARRGRGNTDDSEEGVLATVRKRAAELGCGESTIRKNAQLFNEFKLVLNGEHILDEKGFYQAALTAPDRMAFIEEMAQKKAANPMFSVADAWREAKRAQKKLYEQKNRLSGEATDEKAEERRALRRHFDETRLYLEKRKETCPDRKLAAQLYGAWIQEIADQQDTWFAYDIKDKLIAAWKLGNYREEQMAVILALPQAEVHKVLVELEGDKIFERVKQRGTDQSRGEPQPLWHLVGEPVGD